MSGHRFAALETLMYYVDDDTETVFISVEYRLAPENPAPAALHDSCAGVVWAAENAARLGIDPSKIILNGGSVVRLSPWAQRCCVATTRRANSAR